MKYDLEDMQFDIKAAKNHDYVNAFLWMHTPEGKEYWMEVFRGNVMREEWVAKIDAMITQYNKEHKKDG